MSDLQTKRCLPCEGGVKPLDSREAQDLLLQIQKGWVLNGDQTELSRRFQFKGFMKTVAFMNAVAWIANQENHHPDFEMGFNYCVVKLTTHAIKGLSQNDFIVAAKIDALGAGDEPAACVISRGSDK